MKNLSLNGKRWGIGFFLSVVIVILFLLLIKQYRLLGETIEEERTTYISEIKNQLVKNIKAEKDQQITLVNFYGQALLQLKPENFQEIEDLLSERTDKPEKDAVLLADTEGSVYTADGRKTSLSSKDLLYSLVVEKQAVFGYSQINQGEEFWIYGAPIPDLPVGKKGGGNALCGHQCPARQQFQRKDVRRNHG